MYIRDIEMVFFIPIYVAYVKQRLCPITTRINNNYESKHHLRNFTPSKCYRQ